MKRYDKNQLAAIKANGGYFLVLAPPGCGKTDILAERIAVAKENGVEFGDMLCLTFTNRASRGMRNRVKERIDQEAKDVFIGNIHRYCSKFIFNNNVVPENTSVFDDEDQVDLFLSFEPSYFKNYGGKVNKDAVNSVTTLASYILQSRLGQPEEVKLRVKRDAELYAIAEKCDFDPTLVPVEEKALIFALQYINYKKDKNIIDFDEILILAYEYLRRNEHFRYKWVQVDEVQDLNPLQLAIVDLLTAESPTVMYLGDEQQAIFSFLGAKLDLLALLKERCRGHILSLGNNYRAPDYLLNVCNDYADNQLNVDADLLPKAVNKAEKQKFDLILTESNSADDEYARILGMVNYYLGLSDDERLAILVTKNYEADAISKTLTDAGISNFKISGQDMFKTKSYKTLSSFFSVIANDFNFIAWSRLLYGIGAIPTLVGARNFMSMLKDLMMTPSDMLYDDTYLQRFMRCYEQREFVLFDTETTGLNVLEDDIVQIAAFKVRNGVKVPGSDFDIILETDKEIPLKLGDIDNPLIDRYNESHRYSREEGLRMFLDYIGDCTLVGHNVTYDFLMLKNNVEWTLGESVDFERFDTLHIIKCVAPSMRMYKLEFLVSALNLIGKNSHLANEDIEATKSLIDYCVQKIEPVLPLQEAFKNRVKVKNVKTRMSILVPLIENIQSYLYQPFTVTHRSIADEFRYMHQVLRDYNLIEDLGAKFDIFLQFVQNEWVDLSKNDNLYNQICSHIYDITSTINEGDLVNSQDLLHDRVFIMTVYKGKGLEFENVVVLGACDGTYPFYKVNAVLHNLNATEEEKREAQMNFMEDARKFYVAISRAKKRLCVSYYHFDTWSRYTTLTPFMDCIKHHFHFFAKR